MKAYEWIAKHTRIDARERLRSAKETVALHKQEQYENCLFLIDTEYGDYGGSTVTLSNNEMLGLHFPFLKEMLGDFGYSVRYIPADVEYDESVQDLIEILYQLADYPLYDEDHHASIEAEMKTDAIAEWCDTEVRDAKLQRLREFDENRFRQQVIEAVWASHDEIVIFEEAQRGYVIPEKITPLVMALFAKELEEMEEEEDDE